MQEFAFFDTFYRKFAVAGMHELRYNLNYEYQFNHRMGRLNP